MAEIELWVVDRQGTRIAPLPEANLNHIRWILCKPEQFEFSIDPLSEGASEIESVAREIQVWMDGQLAVWGTPWGLEGGPNEITVTCEGLLSLFTKRFVDRMSLLYTSVDQFNIGWDLLNYAQSEAVEAHRDLNIDAANFGPSGVVRSVNHKRDEHKNILDCLYELDGRERLNGFEWEIVTLPDGGRFWTPYYPRKGSAKPEWKVEWGVDGDERNISTFKWSEDALPLATLAYVTGGTVNTGTVTIKIEGKYEDVDWSEYWGQMQTVISEGSQLDADWLEDRAQQEVNKRKEPSVSSSITSARTDDMDSLFEVFTGDWLPAYIDHGRIQVDAWHRVYEKQWNANDTIDYTFGEAVVVP